MEGEDNLVFSTDYPHGDSKFPEAAKAFFDPPIPDESKRRIAGRTGAGSMTGLSERTRAGSPPSALRKLK